MARSMMASDESQFPESLKASLQQAIYILGNPEVQFASERVSSDALIQEQTMPVFESATPQPAEIYLDVLTALMRSSGEGICVVNPEGQLVFASASIMRVLGYRPSELIGKDMHETIHFQDRQGRPHSKSQCPLNQVLSLGQAMLNHEEALTRKDGTVVEVACSCVPVFHQGTIIGGIVRFHDITERRAEERFLANTIQATTTANQTLRKEFERMRQLVEVSRKALLGTDLSILFQQAVELMAQALPFKFCSISEIVEGSSKQLVYRAVAGFSPDLMIGKVFEIQNDSAEDLLLRQKEPIIISGLSSDVQLPMSGPQSNAGLVSHVLILIPGSDQPFGILTLASHEPHEFDMGEVQFAQTLVNILGIIVGRRSAELALIDSEKALKESNQDLEEFAQMASHELQAPLRKVEKFSEYLKHDIAERLNGDAPDYLQRIQAATFTMRTLIEGLMFLASISHEVRLNQRINLAEVIQEAISQLKEEIDDKKAEIEVGSLCTIEGHRELLKHLFQNLIQNSLKFQSGQVKPQVNITVLQEDHQYCLIQVRDNGIGFSEEQQKRMFKPFERLHSKKKYAGNGLGLSICKKIVERHQGSIKAEGQPDQGASFFIHLPLRQPASNGQVSSQADDK